METKPQQDAGVTMSDYLTDMLKEEKDMQNILEKDETKQCTYEKGYVTQTLFGCHTCGAKGGMCLACYLNCHLDHDTFEIGLKRNFRCDCGTDKFNKHPCIMLEDKVNAEENEKNTYDHNFAAKFCSCNEPYDQNQFMIRCLHCFDYYHLYHLNISEDIQGIVEGNEDFTQVICGTCADKHYKFLQCYTDGNIFYSDQELRDSVKEEEEKKEPVLEKKPSEGGVTLGKRTRSLEEPSCDISEKVKQFENVNDKKPIFVKENWNNNLCYCESCQKIYKENNVTEVLEEEVTNAESWEQPTVPEAQAQEVTPDDIFKDGSLYNQGIQELSKLDFATQSTIAGLYRDFYDEFKEFFEKFKDTLITQDHIQEFFAYLKTKKKELMTV